MLPKSSRFWGGREGSFPSRRLLEYLVLGASVALVFGILVVFISNLDWDFGDWARHYHPAARDLQNPYRARKGLALANPPWLLWILAPFALFPVNISLAAWMITTILLSIWCIKRLGGGVYIIVLCLLTPAFMRLFIQGQIDVIILVGFTLVATADNIWWKSLGYILMAIKPNVLGIGAIVGWIKLPSKEKAIVVAAVLGITVISILLIGFWPRQIYQTITRKMLPSSTGIRIWPNGVPVGLILLGWSVKKRDERIGALSTFFLVPYVGIHSLFPYLAVLFTTIPKIWSTVVFVALWVASLCFV